MIDREIKYAIALVITAGVFLCLGLAIGSSDNKPLSKSEYIKQAKADTPAPPPTHKLGDPEVAAPGWIRTIHYEHRSFVYESDYGFIKVFSPCAVVGCFQFGPECESRKSTTVGQWT